MRKGFTLIELLVAMAVLALMIAFASMVFTVSIDTYRVSMATAEIMQKLRAVTDQLDADFKGLRKDAPLLMWFQLDDPNRYDQIMFFADGDFSSIQVYDKTTERPDLNGSKVVRGNMARVFYGQANVNTHDPGAEPRDPKGPKERKRILAHRQHISDPNIAIKNLEYWPEIDLSDFSETFDGQTKEDRYEHDTLTLAEWQSIAGSRYAGINSVIGISFNNRAVINTSDSKTFHKLLCEGVGSFSIQWAYWDNLNGNDRFYWFPSTDPDSADGSAQSHFVLNDGDNDGFGVYFNVPAPDITDTDWSRVNNAAYQSVQTFAPDFFPAAIKFTFTLYDSKGIIRDGMVFSHIVYLER
jgi:prepilin-type N-terminal cleavage/methylation domain-containing protein